MASILEQLYDGEIFPAEQICVRTKEYKDIRKAYNAHHDAFIKRLTDIAPSLAAQFSEIMDEQLSSVPHEMKETFVHGFRLGARFMAEVLEEHS